MMTIKHFFYRLVQRFVLQRSGEWWALLVVSIALLPFLRSGNITFSDLAFGKDANNYLHYVLGVFNEQFGTPNWFNLPRLFWIIPAYICSLVFSADGHMFLLFLIYGILATSVFSFGSLLRRLSAHRQIPISDMGIAMGAIMYAMNPWVLIRIQHIFILCGYALVPLALSWTWRALGREAWNTREVFPLLPTISELRYQLTLGFVVSASFAGVHFGILIVLCMSGLGVLFATQALFAVKNISMFFRWFAWFFSRAILATISFLLFSAYWVLPFVFSILGGVRPSQNNVNAMETVSAFSRASSLENIFLGISYWWPMFEHSRLSWTFWLAGYSLLAVLLVGCYHSKRWWIAFLTVSLLVFSSGTFFDLLASTYISMVFDTPYPFGDMIRDPNKLYGVAVLPMSLFLAWGVEALGRWLWRGKPVWQWMTVALLSIWIYPIYETFVLGYYVPIVWPEEYQEMYDTLDDISKQRNGDIKVLYLPAGDFALDLARGYSSPDFNTATIQGEVIPKATADHVAFDTRVDTVFPFEGNDINVFYFLMYVHHLLDTEKLEHVGTLFAKAGITHVVMREDHSVWRERFQEYREILDAQMDLKKLWHNDTMTIYEVQQGTSDVSSFSRLVYSTGGMERLTWYPKFFHNSIEAYNWIFPYANHYQTLDILYPNDAVESPHLHDLVLIQLPKERFTFVADTLHHASPNLRWSKIIVSGHDWQHYSKFYHMHNDQFPFDMGAGVAFTTTPYSVPPESYVNPRYGRNILTHLEDDTYKFFHMYAESGMDSVESMEDTSSDLMMATPTNPIRPSSLHMHLEYTEADKELVDVDSRLWKMQESVSFPMEESRLYHLTGKIPRVKDADIELRVAFYAVDGNRIGNATAEIKTLIPDPPMAERSQSFLTPEGTSFGRLEIRMRHTKAESIDLDIHDIALYDLHSWLEHNTVDAQLKEVQPDTAGNIWIRAMCSSKGGDLQIEYSTEQEGVVHSKKATVHTFCDTVAHFVWYRIPVEENIQPMIHIQNYTGIQAINAVVWVADIEYASLEEKVQQQLGDKRVFQMIDSSELQGIFAISSVIPQYNYISGTQLHSVRGTAHTSIEIFKKSVYDIHLAQYFPNAKDSYIFRLYRMDKMNNIGDVLVERTISSADVSPENSTQFVIEDVGLDVGNYWLQIDFLGDTNSIILGCEDMILTENTTRVETETGCVIEQKIEPVYTKGTTQRWSTIESAWIEIENLEEVLLWYEISSENARSIHGKIHYLDAQKQPMHITYLDQIDSRSKSLEKYSHYEKIPKNARYMQLQFLATNTLQNPIVSKYTLENLQMWNMQKSPAIDSIAIIENTGIETDMVSATISNLRKSRGIREFTATNIHQEQSMRLQLYEAPIKHWDIYVDGEKIDGYAINLLSYGWNVPTTSQPNSSHKVYVEIPLNRIWDTGIRIALFGFVLIFALSIQKVGSIQRTLS